MKSAALIVFALHGCKVGTPPMDYFVNARKVTVSYDKSIPPHWCRQGGAFSAELAAPIRDFVNRSMYPEEQIRRLHIIGGVLGDYREVTMGEFAHDRSIVLYPRSESGEIFVFLGGRPAITYCYSVDVGPRNIAIQISGALGVAN